MPGRRRNPSRNRADIPFALTYLFDAGGRGATLAAATGLEAGSPAAPDHVDLETAPAADPGAHPAVESAGGAGPWPLTRVAVSGQAEIMQVVADSPAQVGALPGGPWPEPCRTVLILPLNASGQELPAGALVSGVSPRRPLDDAYRGFLELVAGHVATAVANASTYEAERRRAEALAELDRAKTAFFSNVSHEFRTPLTLLLLPLEDLLADERGEVPPAQREELDVAHRNAMRLLRLVNSVLDFSRIEAGRAQASYEPLDLATLTAGIASMFRSAVERAGLTLSVDAPALPEGVEVYVDRDMWEKIVLNLLSNAFKHTFQGEIAVSLRLAGTRDGQHGTHVELRVRDTGTGIPPDELPRLFERFHRVQGAPARTHEGTGIGLALVQELVKLHGGEIAVESEIGQGTAFTVSIPTGTAHLPLDRIEAAPRPGSDQTPTATRAAPYIEEALRWMAVEEALHLLSEEPLPLVAPPAGTPAAGTAGEGSAGTSTVHPRLRLSGPLPSPGFPLVGRPAGEGIPAARILLADDNADMREYVTRLLRGRYEIEAVADGAAALAAALARPPDLVLSDVMMPRLDGFGLLQALREDPRTRELPVILLSARAGEEAKVEGIDAGADDYLVKPFSARELLARIGTHLSLTRVRAEATGLARAARAQAEALAAENERLYHEAREQADIHVQLNAALRESAGQRDAALASVRASETEVRRQREDFSSILMQAPVPICVIGGSDLTFELANPAYIQVVGGRDVLGKPLLEALPEVTGQGFDDLIRDVMQTGKAVVQSESLVRLERNGTLEDTYFTFIYAPLRNPDGVIDRVIAIVNEVTAQVRARQEVERLAAISAAQKRRYEMMLDASTDHVVLLNCEGHFIYVNRAAAEVIGAATGGAATTPERIVGRTGRELGFTEEFLAHFEANHRRALAGEQTTAETLFPSPQGMRAFEYVLGPVRGVAGKDGEVGEEGGGAVEMVICITRDVQERNASTAERERLLASEQAARDRAEDAVRAQDRFLSIASHELRTPVATVRTSAQLLRRRLARGAIEPDSLDRSLQVMEETAGRLSRLIDDLLDVSRIRTGQLALDVRQVDTAALVEEAVARAAEQCDGSHRFTVEWSQAAPTALAPITADPQRLDQVFDNLFQNAVKYSPDGGAVAVRLREAARDKAAGNGEAGNGATAEGMDRGVQISVRDQGIGLSPGAEQVIFEPFGRAPNATRDNLPGMGLGLHICREVIGQHGGRIWAESLGEGQGTTIHVWLPHTPPASDAPDTTDPPNGAQRSETPNT